MRTVARQFGDVSSVNNSPRQVIIQQTGTIAGDINSASYKDYTVVGSHAIVFTDYPTETGFTIRFYNNTGARRYPTIRWQAMLITMGGGSSGSDIPEYTGTYNVTPSLSSQTLPTANKKMTGDLNVQEIPTEFGQVTQSGSDLSIQ